MQHGLGAGSRSVETQFFHAAKKQACSACLSCTLS